jgi:hypothetical protein
MIRYVRSASADRGSLSLVVPRLLSDCQRALTVSGHRPARVCSRTTMQPKHLRPPTVWQSYCDRNTPREVSMKTSSKLMLAALFTLALSVAIVAAPNKKTIQLTDPTRVGNVMLKPGDYTIEWTVPGPDVQVSFSQGKNTLVTVAATLDSVRSQHDLSFTCLTEESGACSLVKIETKNATLLSAPRDASGGGN